MEMLSDFAAWAWARHHNEWSWFAWRRSIAGMIATVLALATSMFWFPAPEVPHPAVVAALAAEKDYLLGPWTWWKWALAALVPITFFALAAAFWRRSIMLGLIVINGMAITKIVWTTGQFTQDAVLRHLAPALAGLAICNVVILVARQFNRAEAKPR
jgi:hypothetical protein